MLYDTNHNSVGGGGVKARVRVTPRTLYRFALGVWTSINPLTWENRLGVLEVDNDAFRLTFTTFNPEHGLSPFWFEEKKFEKLPVAKVGVPYILELEVSWGAGALKGRVFDERNNLLDEVYAQREVPQERFTDIWVGVAVWTDAVGCPLSNYEVENLVVS